MGTAYVWNNPHFINSMFGGDGYSPQADGHSQGFVPMVTPDRHSPTAAVAAEIKDLPIRTAVAPTLLPTREATPTLAPSNTPMPETKFHGLNVTWRNGSVGGPEEFTLSDAEKLAGDMFGGRLEEIAAKFRSNGSDSFEIKVAFPIPGNNLKDNQADALISSPGRDGQRLIAVITDRPDGTRGLVYITGLEKFNRNSKLDVISRDKFGNPNGFGVFKNETVKDERGKEFNPVEAVTYQDVDGSIKFKAVKLAPGSNVAKLDSGTYSFYSATKGQKAERVAIYGVETKGVLIVDKLTDQTVSGMIGFAFGLGIKAVNVRDYNNSSHDQWIVGSGNTFLSIDMSRVKSGDKLTDSGKVMRMINGKEVELTWNGTTFLGQGGIDIDKAVAEVKSSLGITESSQDLDLLLEKMQGRITKPWDGMVTVLSPGDNETDTFGKPALNGIAVRLDGSFETGKPEGIDGPLGRGSYSRQFQVSDVDKAEIKADLGRFDWNKTIPLYLVKMRGNGIDGVATPVKELPMADLVKLLGGQVIIAIGHLDRAHTGNAAPYRFDGVGIVVD